MVTVGQTERAIGERLVKLRAEQDEAVDEVEGIAAADSTIHLAADGGFAGWFDSLTYGDLIKVANMVKHEGKTASAALLKVAEQEAAKEESKGEIIDESSKQR